MIRITKVTPRDAFQLELQFDDCTHGTVDLSDLAGKGVFEIWHQQGVFDKVRLDSGTRAVRWDDEVEICADSLYLKISGKTIDDLKAMDTADASH